MSETPTAPAATPVPGPATVLVEPQLGENIGAAARALANFGLADLRLVRPRDGWPNPRAIAVASGASRVLDAARLCADTPEAIADLHMVYATTARPRGIAKRVLTPEAAVAEARARSTAGERVGFLYGRERTGLETPDVLRADAIVTVPVDPAFPSLNLAQCVLLIGYEWRRQAGTRPPEVEVTHGARRATAGEVAGLLDHLEGELDAAGYFWPEGKRAAMSESVRNIFQRLGLTDQDVRTLRGAVRALAQGPRRRRPVAMPEGAVHETMETLRAAIDALDAELVHGLARRQRLIERAAEIKARDGLPALISPRVEAVVAKVRAAAADRDLDPDLVEALWRRLIQAAVALEAARLGR